MFHYDKDSTDQYGIDHAQGFLFCKVSTNPLMNKFGFNVLSKLHTFWNMKSFRVDKDTDIAAYVCHVTILHDSTRVYRFSKELLALIETLVAFSPYYVANDPNAAGPIDTTTMRHEYLSITYDALHGFIIDGLREWYRQWPPDPEFDLDGAQEDVV